MQYPKLTIFLSVVAIALGQVLIADSPRESLLFKAADGVRDAATPIVKRIEWRAIRWRAARGDACAIGQVAAAHYNGYRLVDFEYSGLDFDREKARELFFRSAELGCEPVAESLVFYDLAWPDQLAPYRDDVGRVDWQKVQAAASTGDPDARYFIATTMKRSRAQARMRGIEFDPERGDEMLARLAAEGHMDALLHVADAGSGITPELNRAYYALMDTTWKVMPTLRIHMRFLETAIEECSPSAWAKAMDIWSTLGMEVHASDAMTSMLGGAHERYLSTCSGPDRAR